MVDPNRKINRLNAEDIAFLDECEELFGHRFTESDDVFKAHCETTSRNPPVVMNFTTGGGGGGGHGGGQRQNNSYRGRYNDLRHNYRGGRGGGQRSYHKRDNPYNNNRRGSGGGEDGRYRQHNRNNYRSYHHERNDEHAMNVRREYGKFVAASKSDHSPVDNG